MSEPLGIIHPPPELRGIVDSTAKYVAKNGGAFEERIMREHKNKPKFSFLFPEDPFNAYYRHKVKEIRQQILNESEAQQQNRHSHPSLEPPNHDTRQSSNNVDKQSENHSGEQAQPEHPPDRQSSKGLQEATDPGENRVRFEEPAEDRDNDTQSGTKEAGVRPQLGEYMQEISMKLEEPPNLNFLANPASSITQLESDIMKLTSQYIANYGQAFLLELVSREQSNSRFDFVNPQHGQFPYMMNLIMQYALIINAPLDILYQLEKDATTQKHVLERIKMRAEWNRMLEVERRKRDEAKESEKLLYSQIDWHDFVIVETIDFKHGEIGAYPPTTPDQVGTRLLQQQRTEDHTQPEEMDIDMDME